MRGVWRQTLGMLISGGRFRDSDGDVHIMGGWGVLGQTLEMLIFGGPCGEGVGTDIGYVNIVVRG